MGSQWNFTYILMGSIWIAVQNSIDLTMTLTFQGHNYIKSYFGPYLGSCRINCHQIVTLGSLGWSPSTNPKISWGVWTWDVRERVTLASIMQKDVFGHNFRTKALGMTILASRYMFWGQGIWWCHLFWPMTLTFQGHDLCKIILWTISQLLMGKMLPKINTR